ncbi:iron-siderophore ABC transporter substrate-binding protein [Devosia neptuniae]|jgi:iron complex transport system substrate-binding protein|uniref:ABC transporter substrate-binding protein n=1 Tax=Devosia TaxID=46913 RepID=UPI0022B02C4A|nr:iron-siderophore ABC transporter substrate-binding protein [Devosia neptuniae]MCZ4345596.1 iron-siderophore ABC transporter substrate-binding protein [Devosia neptuniae]|tara:strand:- start:46086 stop:47003 length:918 start_codon:yes stop_codon:yes gene_type:complete
MTNPLLAAALLALALIVPTQAREITHAMGVTEVPDAPVRVAILTNEGTEALLHLGVVPVGAAQSWQGNPFYPHLADQLADTVSLGTETAINLEVLASLEPDIIIGTVFRHEKVYEQLSAIAPTILSATIGPQWLENYAFYGQAVGLGDKAQTNVAAFKDRAAALGEAIGDGVNEEVSLVRFAPGRTRIYSDHSFAGVVLDLVGFQRPALQRSEDTFVQIGKERIPEMDADRIFYFAPDDDNVESMANLGEWLNDPLFLQLDATEAGKATRVRELSWNLGGGIYSAYMMLDEIADIYDVTLPAQAD